MITSGYFYSKGGKTGSFVEAPRGEAARGFAQDGGLWRDRQRRLSRFMEGGQVIFWGVSDNRSGRGLGRSFVT
jgi:hypothetical protein